ncbi:MAG TPA: RIP metalloprotease RseP [Burkholderiaceae bacterium]|nr:RIP metalloprotease RseP [Burkholderiaceae bacterium]
MQQLVYFLITISILVVWHELGHYWAARRCGVRVQRFSIGFGPVLFSRVSPRTGVQWAVSAIPLGGYVAMDDARAGQPESLEPHTSGRFSDQSLINRAIIILAGPVANLVLALILYWLIAILGSTAVAPVVGPAPAGSLFASSGFTQPLRLISIDGVEVKSMRAASLELLDRATSRQRVEVVARPLAADAASSLRLQLDFSGLQRSDIDGNVLARLGLAVFPGPARIASVRKEGAAAAAGLQEGDLIIQVADQPVTSSADVSTRVRAAPNTPLSMLVERAGRRLAIDVTPQMSEDGRTGVIGIGFSGPDRLIEKFDPIAAVSEAVKQTWSSTVLTLRMLWQIATGQAALSNLSGPLTIADVASQSASFGLVSFLSFLAVVSVGLFVFNLLPVPQLDGGHLLYFAYEAMTGRAPSERALLFGQRFGLIVLGLVMAIALSNDVLRRLPAS